jgi:hypothetical protein
VNGPISVAEFMRANGMDPSAGLSGPMTSNHTSSLRDLIAKLTPRWSTVRGCFRDEDVQHMLYGSPQGAVKQPFNLGDYSDVRRKAPDILVAVSSSIDSIRMPPPPEDPWGPTLINLFWRWVAGGTPQ